MKMKGLSMKDEGDSLILTLIGEGRLLNLIGETDFLILFMTKEEET